MLRRRTLRPFLIYSLIIHGIIISIMMKIWLEPRHLPSFEPDFTIDITHVTEPRVTPPKVEEPTEPPPAPDPVKIVKKPAPTSNSDWLSIDSIKSRQRSAISAKADRTLPPEETSIASQSRMRAGQRPKVRDAGISAVSLPQVASEKVVLPPGQNQAVEINSGEKALEASSPEVGSTESRFWHRRGAVLEGAPMGNTSGGGSASGTGVQNNYVLMMNELARNLAEAATAREIDLVFVIDRTGSMEDNVRGIRAYIDFFFEHLTREGHDTAVGLVTFADAIKKKPKARGLTTDTGKFKNWLYKIKFEGGADLAESGLDALMTALAKIKFRHGAQRFFVLASDAGFHDADYDGRSEYSLDQVIAALQNDSVRVDVIGLDYLPIKQIAWATKGTWRAIPGRGYLEYIPPLTLTSKMLSELGSMGFSGDSLADELIVTLSRRTRPKWLKVSWKVLNPLGEKCYGPFEQRVTILDDGSDVARFIPPIDVGQFRTMEGTYTVIYRLENNLGHKSILRRAFDF